MSSHAQDELGATKGLLADEQEKLLARETEISDLLRKVTDSEHKVTDSEREAQRLADVEETLALQVLSLGKDSLGLGHPSLPFSLSPPDLALGTGRQISEGEKTLGLLERQLEVRALPPPCGASCLTASWQVG